MKYAIRRIIICLLTLIILIRPTIPADTVARLKSDLNVIFILDSTGSMLAKDHKNSQSRLDAAKQDIKPLSSLLSGARFSLIAFDNTPYIALPFTTNTTSLETAVSTISPINTAYSIGSNISAPLDLAQDLISQNSTNFPDRKTAVFFLSDGEQSAKYQLNIPENLKTSILGGAVLGYGSTSGSRIHEVKISSTGNLSSDTPIITDSKGTPVITKLNPENLKTIANSLSLDYADKNTPNPLNSKADKIRKSVSKTQTSDKTSSTELYWIISFALFILLLLEINRLITNTYPWRTAK